MGCDIHDYCEIKTDNGWEMVGKVFKDPYDKGKKHEHPYDMRNYRLFGMLAGVRCDRILPISIENRGVPKDASGEYKAIVDQWRGDGHSHSYYTLKELLDYHLYDFPVDLKGLVSSAEYKIFKKQGKPNSYAGSVGGYRTYCVSNEEMDEYLGSPEEFLKKNIKRLVYEQEWMWRQLNDNCPAYKSVLKDIELVEHGEIPELSFYTEVAWKESVKECIGDWWFDETLEKMKELAPDGDYEKIRMMFFFDN